MAMDETRLKNALKPQIETQIRTFIGLGVTAYPELTKFSEALATAIAKEVLTEIVTNAVLNNAKFSGTFPGTVTGATCSTPITNQAVTGGIV